LERRLARVETATGVNVVFKVIYVSFVGCDTDRAALRSATIGGRVWPRAEGEAKDAFLDRVNAEADGVFGTVSGRGARVVFLKTDRDTEHSACH
jgi:hypothetical protein